MFLAIISVILMSCTEEYKVSRDIEGTWDIAIYQKTVYKAGTVDMDNSGSFENKGKMEFNSNGKGYYTILVDLGSGVYSGSSDFTWTNTSSSVSITTGTETRVFEIVARGENSFEMEREVSDFYFSGSEPGVKYSLYERILLEK
jgi:hypothetical protein